jgi:hypothetical protein
MNEQFENDTEISPVLGPSGNNFLKFPEGIETR